MTRKRRYLIAAAVLAACVCLALGVLAMLPSQPGVTKAHFGIEKGMTRADAVAILGHPSFEGNVGGVWVNSDGRLQIYLRFDENDKIYDIDFYQPTETLPDKLRRWLHFPK